MLELNKLYLMDCMEGMKQFPDKYFELAIVDPPYGGGAGCLEWKGNDSQNKELGVHFHGRGRSAKYNNPVIKVHRESCPGGSRKQYNNGSNINHWDIAPTQEYFDELFRVSKNQIIWGGNYFELPPTRCFLVWRKLTISENFTMAMCEYAWTSFNDNAKWIEIAPQDSKRFHPTQKPVALYTWLLNNYTHKGDKILDTHCGSASSLIACHKLGFDYIGFEIDEDYYNAATERLDTAKSQISMFDEKEPEAEYEQVKFI